MLYIMEVLGMEGKEERTVLTTFPDLFIIVTVSITGILTSVFRYKDRLCRTREYIRESSYQSLCFVRSARSARSLLRCREGYNRDSSNNDKDN